MDHDEAAFYAAIAGALAAHPDWLRSAVSAICDGMTRALASANTRAADANLGMLCALSLLKPGRLTADAVELLNKKVLDALAPGECATEIEQKTRERLSKE